MRTAAFALFPLLLLSSAAAAGPEPASVFGDRMVLQRGRPVPVWGKAVPGERITVRIGSRSASGRAGRDGRWRVRLPALAAGGPAKLVIHGAKSGTTVLRDVLVGEVWICSGQSNMAWPVSRALDGSQEVKAARYPGIRLLTVPRRAAFRPQETFPARWFRCDPKTVGSFSAVGYFFGREIHRRLRVPVGLINTSYGGTPVAAWTPGAAPGPASGKANPRQPSTLYNAMVAPLVPLAFRGVVWYQGESDAGRARRYRDLFPGMIEKWRKAFGQGDFPFYFVQLANFRARRAEPGESAWAELREAQLLTLGRVPNTGMAVAIDIGEEKSIHPRNKQEVGRRLALWALARDYGRKVECSGPLYAGHERRGSAVVVRFTHAEGLAAKGGGRLRGFALAGEDGKFRWAEARIEGETVVVSHPSVKKPAAVRYDWADNPDGNLVNGAGLPASPFRTDDRPGVTGR